MATQRNTEIDGWRAFAVLGVMWHHWAPKEWKGVIPFEIGLFFFLTLTGFLITRILLRERDAHSGGGLVGWSIHAGFLRRRFGRILLPSMAAMLFALLVGAPDILAHPWWYLSHLSNYLMAMRDQWPSGTAPFWSLAIQIQFYLLWPLGVLWLPRMVLPYLFCAALMAAPCSRWVFSTYLPEVRHAEAIPLCALDYFGAGALLAWFLGCGWSAGHPLVRRAAVLGFAAYGLIYLMREAGPGIPYTRPVQQTFLAIGMTGLIGCSLHGFRGWIGRILTHPVVQHVGRISYGLYLFHALVPLLIGQILPFLWTDGDDRPSWMLAIRIVVFAGASWGIAWLCWKNLERGRT